jgi:hypothetical protein
VVLVEVVEEPFEGETFQEIDFRPVAEAVDTVAPESFFGVGRSETLMATVEASASVVTVA